MYCWIHASLEIQLSKQWRGRWVTKLPADARFVPQPNGFIRLNAALHPFLVFFLSRLIQINISTASVCWNFLIVKEKCSLFPPQAWNAKIMAPLYHFQSNNFTDYKTVTSLNHCCEIAGRVWCTDAICIQFLHVFFCYNMNLNARCEKQLWYSLWSELVSSSQKTTWWAKSWFTDLCRWERWILSHVPVHWSCHN